MRQAAVMQQPRAGISAARELWFRRRYPRAKRARQILSHRLDRMRAAGEISTEQYETARAWVAMAATCSTAWGDAVWAEGVEYPPVPGVHAHRSAMVQCGGPCRRYVPPNVIGSRGLCCDCAACSMRLVRGMRPGDLLSDVELSVYLLAESRRLSDVEIALLLDVDVLGIPAIMERATRKAARLKDRIDKGFVAPGRGLEVPSSCSLVSIFDLHEKNRGKIRRRGTARAESPGKTEREATKFLFKNGFDALGNPLADSAVVN